MYRPNFCCECGKRIVHLRWRFWHSRKFCKACARKFTKERYLPVLLTSTVLVAAGFVFGRSRVPAPPPLLIERRADSPLNNLENKAGEPPVPTTTPATIEEDVYICGARTKKGTPCSRRVHGPVRCWQHKGMPAMLPQEKLRVR